MNGEHIGKALGALPGSVLKEAIQLDSPQKIMFFRVLRSVAILVVIVALLLWLPQLHPSVPDTPSFLSVTVYASDLSSSTTLSSDTVLPLNYQWNIGVNSMPGQPITLSVFESDYTSENITFQLTVDGGGFYVGEGDTGYYVGEEANSIFIPRVCKAMPNQFTAPNNTTIFWNPTIGAAEGNTFFREGTVAFTDIIIFDGDKIIGYAVLRFDRESPAHSSFVISMLESVSFPPKNEAITEDYVRSLIQKAKEN